MHGGVVAHITPLLKSLFIDDSKPNKAVGPLFFFLPRDRITCSLAYYGMFPDLIGSLPIQDRKPNHSDRHFKNPDLTKINLRVKNPI